jgi:hypothetical protein
MVDLQYRIYSDLRLTTMARDMLEPLLSPRAFEQFGP